MKRAIVIYESIYGNTGRLALAIAEGIKRAGDIECDVVKTNEVHHTDDLVGYDAILFGCPNHNQEPARNMIKFLERAAIVELQGKIGAAFDTYTGGNKGIVVGKLEDLIREKIPGVTLAVDGFSALAEDRKGPLAAGEISQAKEFGNAIGLELLKGS